MVVNDIGTILGSIKNLTEFILSELQSLQRILKITNEQFPIYESTIYSLQYSINNLEQIFKYKIPIQHILKFNLLEIIQLKLNKFFKTLDKFKEWNINVVKPSCMNFKQFIFMLSNPRPSFILAKLEKTFIEIEPLIKEQILLEEKILGTAIRIEHPILQKAWLMVGGNQLCDTEISCSLMIDNLYSMLVIEQNNYIPNKEHLVKKITEFVKSIDGIAGSKPDDKLSITEINLFKATNENVKTIKDLIGINDKDLLENEENEENVEQLEIKYIDIPTNFSDPVKVNYLGSRTIKEPYCTGYGADFNNVNACEFIIPDDLLIDERYKLYGIHIECVATDQGFGGTNQSHMRYQINDDVTVKVFQVDRHQFPTGIYNFSIPSEQIKNGDIVKLWIFAPGWNGWSMSLNKVTATGRFVPIK